MKQAGNFLDQVGDDLYCSSSFSVFSMYNLWLSYRRTGMPEHNKGPIIEAWDLFANHLAMT